jgi:hypothetical protein
MTPAERDRHIVSEVEYLHRELSVALSQAIERAGADGLSVEAMCRSVALLLDDVLAPLDWPNREYYFLRTMWAVQGLLGRSVPEAAPEYEAPALN